MNEKVILTPPIKTLIFGIRSIGYTFSSAVADLVDNSISANAKNIDIYSDPDDEIPYFQIIDDGCGMNKEELKNAMTLGSDRDGKLDSNLELGRFGMGLKMASLSQCRSLTVISKKYGKIRAALFDIDHIEETNDWEILFLKDEEIQKIPNIEKLTEKDTGTIVMWTNFDRLEISAQDFVDSFRKVVSDSKKHLEYVFHRFYNDINIMYHGRKIERRDPFLTSSYPKSQIGQKTIITIPEQEGIGEVIPYTLPFSNQLTSEEKALLGNPGSIYDEQGFYIYRNKRLILWGSWLRMGIKSELNKHSRVLIDIPSAWDSIWSLDIKKSSAKIPDILKDRIKIAVEDTIVKSKKIVRGKGQKEGNAANPTWFKQKFRDGSKYIINRQSPILMNIFERSSEETIKLLNIFLDQVETHLPQFRIISDNAESIQIYNVPENNNDELLEQLIVVLKTFERPLERLNDFLEYEVYQPLESRREEIVRRLKNE